MAESPRVARLRSRRQVERAVARETAQRAIGYARVSTEEQAISGHGLDYQERAIRAFASSQGYELLEVVTEAGVSGSTRPAERPGFSRLTQSIIQSKSKILLVWKFDRLARQIVYAVTAANDLAQRHGLVIRSVTEPIDTSTPMGRTIFAVLAGMAEQELQAITERTWHGRKEKAMRGGFAGGAAPYGYRHDKDGGLVIDEAEAAIVQRVFALHAGGMAQAAIARMLNAEGIPTRRGGTWRQSQIGYMLENPRYKGMSEYLFRWQGAEQHVLVPGAHQAIVASSPRI